ncbi:hypothetical protein HYS03_02025 [Candidatus Woesebacteria bacterium]|nr:hypothetical protein [Candidatus Woesebacteria bacterium]QQG47465.1 MAG: hypothetical protein HY044_05085 [Candidatus Woesebacteria bacterium]
MKTRILVLVALCCVLAFGTGAQASEKTADNSPAYGAEVKIALSDGSWVFCHILEPGYRPKDGEWNMRYGMSYPPKHVVIGQQLTYQASPVNSSYDCSVPIALTDVVLATVSWGGPVYELKCSGEFLIPSSPTCKLSYL